jgi:hypothetical protein
MRGFALNVHTRTLIINAVWALTVIQFGRVASSTQLAHPPNYPSLFSRRPPVVAALPSVLPRIIPLLPPGDQGNPPLLDESRRGACVRKMLLLPLPRCVALGVVSRLVLPVSRLVLPEKIHLLLSPPGRVRLLMKLLSPPGTGTVRPGTVRLLMKLLSPPGTVRLLMN